VIWSLFSKPRSDSDARQAAGRDRQVALAAALAELERLIAARPELESAGRVLARVLEAAFGEPARPLVPGLEEDFDESDGWLDPIRSAWEKGEPALPGLALALEGSNLAERALAVCAAIGSDGSPPADRLHRVIEREPERVFDWVKLALRLGDGSLAQAACECKHDLDPIQVESVLRLSVLPTLAEVSHRICARLPEGAWRHGTCPVCGSGPALAESRGLEQRRHLRCDRCAADWPCQHFVCASCGTSDHHSLRYAFVEGEQDRYRLAICDACGGRLKIIATIVPLSPPGLLVAELAAIHLDFLGRAPQSPGE
jgi:FdhE protein